jgi:hypothetical protein
MSVPMQLVREFLGAPAPNSFPRKKIERNTAAIFQ